MSPIGILQIIPVASSAFLYLVFFVLRFSILFLKATPLKVFIPFWKTSSLLFTSCLVFLNVCYLKWFVLNISVVELHFSFFALPLAFFANQCQSSCSFRSSFYSQIMVLRQNASSISCSRHEVSPRKLFCPSTSLMSECLQMISQFSPLSFFRTGDQIDKFGRPSNVEHREQLVRMISGSACYPTFTILLFLTQSIFSQSLFSAVPS